MIREIHRVLPETVVIYSTLLPHKVIPREGQHSNIRAINAEYRKLQAKLRETSRPTYLAELEDLKFIVGGETGDIHDDVHPTMTGNLKIAAVFVKTIEVAASEGKIKPAKDSGIPDTSPGSGSGMHTCEKRLEDEYVEKPMDGCRMLYAANTQVIVSDGDYRHHGVRMESVFSELMNKYQPDQLTPRFLFAQLAKLIPKQTSKLLRPT